MLYILKKNESYAIMHSYEQLFPVRMVYEELYDTYAKYIDKYSLNMESAANHR